MPASFIHETACVDPGARVGVGTKIWHFCHVMSGATIGRDCVLGQNVFVASGVTIGDGTKIQNNVSVYDGVTLEDGVFCGPSVVFTNIRTPRAHIVRRDAFVPTRVCRGASLGANATIVCGVTVGAWALVGAGAVVTRDVAPYAIVAGVPAAVIGWACTCGATLVWSDPHRGQCPECARAYHATGAGAADPAAGTIVEGAREASEGANV